MSSEPGPCILVVDDDAGIRAVVAATLRGLGFAVRTAPSGAEALDDYRRHDRDIALVLLDVRMPGLDGPQTLQALRSINPQVRCCFMTGGAGSYSSEQLLDLGAWHILTKPFGSLDELGRLLGQAAAPTSLPPPHIRCRRRSATEASTPADDPPLR